MKTLTSTSKQRGNDDGNRQNAGSKVIGERVRHTVDTVAQRGLNSEEHSRWSTVEQSAAHGGVRTARLFDHSTVVRRAQSLSEEQCDRVDALCGEEPSPVVIIKHEEVLHECCPCATNAVRPLTTMTPRSIAHRLEHSWRRRAHAELHHQDCRHRRAHRTGESATPVVVCASRLR